jgi:hypothetical protein
MGIGAIPVMWHLEALLGWRYHYSLVRIGYMNLHGPRTPMLAVTWLLIGKNVQLRFAIF